MQAQHAISSIRFAFGAAASIIAALIAGIALASAMGALPAEPGSWRWLFQMKPAASICVIACAASWFLLQSSSRKAHRFGVALAFFVVAVSLSHLFERATGLSIGVDRLLPPDEQSAGSSYPGRLSVASAVALMLAGVALALTRSTTSRADDVRQFARLTGFAIPLFMLALYLYDVSTLGSIQGFEGASIGAGVALSLILLAVGFDRSTASLRWQIAQIGVAVVAPLAALTLHFASAERTIELRHAADRLNAVARGVAERQDGLIEQARQMLVFLGRADETRGGGEACQKELGEYQPLNPAIRGLFVIGRDGRILCGNRPDFAGIDVADRDYVRDAFATGKFVVSGFFLSRPSNQPRIAVALPITPDLIIAASLDVNALGAPFEGPSVEAASTSTITLVDRIGAVIARRPKQDMLVGASMGDATFVAQALSGETRVFEAAELDGRPTVFVARPVLWGQGTLIVGVPRSDVVGPVDQRLNGRLLLIAAILAGSLAVAVLGGELLVLGPLRRLIDYARRLEAGEPGARPDTDARGEVGALARALSVSAAAIEDREHRLAETEALFRGLFDNAPDAKVVVRVEPDETLRIETWNTAAEAFTGIRPADAIGRVAGDLFSANRAEAIESDLRRVLSLRKLVTVERTVTANGAPSVFEVTQGPLFSADGERIERIFIAARDISERKRVERLKNEFVSTVSHELRTPLTSIAGSLGLLVGGAAGPLGDRVKQLISIAHSNSLRLVRLINDILDIEKIEAGRMTFEIRTLVVLDLVEQAIMGLKAYADEYGVAVEIAPGGEGLQVRGDPDRLTQVFTNLLSNAIKFSPKGGAVLVSILGDGAAVSIKVRDFGPGIPESFRSRVFSKFAQADGSDSRRKGGTGLGLAIVREIVERHAGAVSYETGPNQGTEFEVRLPRHAPPRVVDRSPEAAPPRPGQRVLICEDDLLIATILAEQMQDAGFEASTAGTVREALRMVEAGGVDAVLVDLNLPDGDGISLIRDLRATEKGSRIPIVVVSADAGRGRSDVRAPALDVADWLEKPVDTRRLATLLQKQLRQGGGHRPRILHVEDDRDLCDVVSAALSPIADVVQAPSLAAARIELDREVFDLAIIDVTLEDGSGLDLLATLKRNGPKPTPAVVFSARDVDRAAAPTAEATITKSRTSLSTLVDTIRALIMERQDGAQGDSRRRGDAA